MRLEEIKEKNIQWDKTVEDYLQTREGSIREDINEMVEWNKKHNYDVVFAIRVLEYDIKGIIAYVHRKNSSEVHRIENWEVAGITDKDLREAVPFDFDMSWGHVDIDDNIKEKLKKFYNEENVEITIEVPESVAEYLDEEEINNYIGKEYTPGKVVTKAMRNYVRGRSGVPIVEALKWREEEIEEVEGEEK